MNMIFQNVRVILVVDPTMQGDDETEVIPRLWLPRPSLMYLRASLWECCKIPWAASTHKLALQLRKEKKIDSLENTTCLHWFAD